MKRTTAVVALLFLATAAAGAQPLRPQPFSATSARGITVNGAATERVPATTARIMLQFSSADHKMTLDRTTLHPIVDALVQAGADPASVRLPLNFSAPGASNAASIAATVARPTAALMQHGIVLVGTAVASARDLVLNGAQIFLSAANCAPALDVVRRRALQNARVKASSIARDLGVRVGRPLSVTSMDATLPDGSCSWQYYIGAFGPAQTQSPADMVSVPVTSTVTITYAIE